MTISVDYFPISEQIRIRCRNYVLSIVSTYKHYCCNIYIVMRERERGVLFSSTNLAIVAHFMFISSVFKDFKDETLLMNQYNRSVIHIQSCSIAFISKSHALFFLNWPLLNTIQLTCKQWPARAVCILSKSRNLKS